MHRGSYYIYYNTLVVMMSIAMGGMYKRNDIHRWHICGSDCVMLGWLMARRNHVLAVGYEARDSVSPGFKILILHTAS